MQKLLKYKKLFMMGLLTAAVAMFVPSCSDDDDDGPEDDDAYKATVTIIGGSGAGAAVAEENDGTYIPVTFAYAGELVYLYRGTPTVSGDVFLGWTSVPTSFANSITPVTGQPGIYQFNMPSYDVTITANWGADDAEYFSVIIKDEQGNIISEEDYEEGEIVTVSVAAPGIGLQFVKWMSLDDNVDFDDETNRTTTFEMPAEDVVVFPEIISDGWAYVRYTWEAAEQENINYVIASEDDIAEWLNTVYLDIDGDYDDEDFTDEPKFNGNPYAPDELYVYAGSTANKGKYFKGKYFKADDMDDPDEGWYTAVTSVYDELFDSDAFIVANYRIEFGDFANASDRYYDLDADRWFEIAFDVGTFLAGEDDLGWFSEVRDNPDDPARLEKRKGKRMMKKVAEKKVANSIGTLEVKYFVIRGPKN